MRHLLERIFPQGVFAASPFVRIDFGGFEVGLLESTRFFLAEVERASGRPVVVQEDSSLQTLTTCQTARGTAPMHLLRYRPIPNRPPDYLICYQCGFLIRLFENEPGHRFSLALDPEGSKQIDEWLAEGQVPSHLRQAKDFLLSGLLTQLRSIPIGLRIDDLIWTRHEELREQQVASARLQLAENAGALKPAIRQMFPRKMLQANTAMNAAFAQFWAEKTGDPTLRLPYQSVGAEADGQGLMNLFAAMDPGSSEDWKLVDAWADRLGLSGWYKWIPHELEP